MTNAIQSSGGPQDLSLEIKFKNYLREACKSVNDPLPEDFLAICVCKLVFLLQLLHNIHPRTSDVSNINLHLGGRGFTITTPNPDQETMHTKKIVTPTEISVVEYGRHGTQKPLLVLDLPGELSRVLDEVLDGRIEHVLRGLWKWNPEWRKVVFGS